MALDLQDTCRNYNSTAKDLLCTAYKKKYTHDTVTEIQTSIAFWPSLKVELLLNTNNFLETFKHYEVRKNSGSINVKIVSYREYKNPAKNKNFGVPPKTKIVKWSVINF